MKNALRSLYQVLPLKRHLFHLIRAIARPGKDVYKHLYFRGDFSVPIDRSHSIVVRHYGFELENEVFWRGLHGGWEKTSIGLWTQLVPRADVIFDIGANTGMYSLIAKSLNPKSTVYAFEPLRRVYEKLLVNNKLNDFDIICIELAASNADGKAIVYDTPAEHTYSVTVNKNLLEEGDEAVPTDISITRLDTFIEARNINKLDLIKIDVETHEPEVLEGLGKYLDEFKPTMLIEILNDEVGSKVELLVKDKGYLYFNIDEASDSVRRVEKITKSDFYNYLLCSETVASSLRLI